MIVWEPSVRMLRVRTPAVASLAAILLSAGALLLSAPAAVAAPPPEQPVSGDDRATAFPGNIKENDCAGAGLDGSAIEVTATITDNTFIDITDVPDGFELTGVVVKGGDAYNVYRAEDVEEWTGLHAPLAGNSGKPAEISHWFACGEEVETTTTETTTTETTTTESSSTESTTTDSSTTDSSEISDTSSPGTPGGSDEDGLASTGLAGGPAMLTTGLLLVLAGAGLVYANRRRAFGRHSA
jgi:hypothetical protein